MNKYENPAFCQQCPLKRTFQEEVVRKEISSKAADDADLRFRVYLIINPELKVPLQKSKSDFRKQKAYNITLQVLVTQFESRNKEIV